MEVWILITTFLVSIETGEQRYIVDSIYNTQTNCERRVAKVYQLNSIDQGMVERARARGIVVPKPDILANAKCWSRPMQFN